MHPINRRQLIQGSAYLAAELITRKAGPAQVNRDGASPGAPSNAMSASFLARYVDKLPIPEIAQPSGFRPDPFDHRQRLPYYRLAMRQLECKLHRDLPAAQIWGFGRSSPGPTFETRTGQGLIVEWANELPQKHFLPIDRTLHGAETGVPEVRSVVHLHGGKTPPESDGYPESWYVPGRSGICHYPNQQEACMLFYHDHTMGINRLNIYAGLFGMFFVRDENESALKLPSGQYEVPLLVYDRFLRPDGQLVYPVSSKPGAPWVPEVFGDALLVNGKIFPYLDVEPRQYRFRLMNGSNGRFFRFSLGSGLAFEQIGTEQGFLPSRTSVKRALMAPGERLDFLFDFSEHAGEKILLRSDALEIMEFRVRPRTVATAVGSASRQAAEAGGDGTKPANSPLPASQLPPLARLKESDAIATRRLTLDEKLDDVSQSMGMLLNNTPWHMPVTEKPVADTVEIWELVNLTDDSHPIHLHLVRFQILDRRPLDRFAFQDKGTVRFTGPPVPPEAHEAGWKDTVRADPNAVTRIIVPFTGFTGRYVWHCHILEHEDNEMMRPYEVVAAAREQQVNHP